MSQPYIGEIRMFPGTFAPLDWAFCNGQLVPINQNQALFALLGTTYGGDGVQTFGLPDLQGRVPVHFGQGPGLSALNVGDKGGVESVALTVNQTPNHGHAWTAMGAAGTADKEKLPGGYLANGSLPVYDGTPTPGQTTPLDPSMVGAVGGNQPHSNMGPYLAINFIMALFGIFPSRS
jgi:microcystin-dependent protein